MLLHIMKTHQYSSKVWIHGWCLLMLKFDTGQYMHIYVLIPVSMLACMKFSVHAWMTCPLWFCWKAKHCAASFPSHQNRLITLYSHFFMLQSLTTLKDMLVIRIENGRLLWNYYSAFTWSWSHDHDSLWLLQSDHTFMEVWLKADSMHFVIKPTSQASLQTTKYTQNMAS